MTATKDSTRHTPRNSAADTPEPGTPDSGTPQRGTAHGTASTTATATTTETAATATTARDTADGTAAERIGGARERIDALDGRIIALVQERMHVSEGIQQERMSTGGRRVHLSREMAILDHYRAELGRPGTQLAMTLLALCRGKL